MLRLLALGEQDVAALEDHSAERVCRSCCSWRTLPSADAAAVDERRVRMPIVARAF